MLGVFHVADRRVRFGGEGMSLDLARTESVGTEPEPGGCRPDMGRQGRRPCITRQRRPGVAVREPALFGGRRAVLFGGGQLSRQPLVPGLGLIVVHSLL